MTFDLLRSQLLRDVTPKRRSRRQLAQLDQRSPYITACFKQLPSSFTVGTDHSYSNCENKPLEPGQEYVFFLLAELSSATGVGQTCVLPSSVFFRSFF